MFVHELSNCYTDMPYVNNVLYNYQGRTAKIVVRF